MKQKLSQLRSNQTGRINSISPQYLNSLLERGFIPGEEIEVRQILKSRLIVEVGGTSWGIEREIAASIEVIVD